MNPNAQLLLALTGLISACSYGSKIIYTLIMDQRRNGNSKLLEPNIPFVCNAIQMPERLAPILDHQTEVLGEMKDQLTRLCTIMDERRPNRR